MTEKLPCQGSNMAPVTESEPVLSMLAHDGQADMLEHFKCFPMSA